MLKIRFSTKLILFGILILAAYLRFYNLNWDQGFHLHPDERAIIMAIIKLQYPESFIAFLSPQSPWNTNFFAYGSFPFYLLKIVGDTLVSIDFSFAKYDAITIVGRYISALSDLVSLIFVFLIGRKLFSTYVGLVAAFFYGVSVLPIQLSHFYAVDTLLTCFILATLYHLLRFYEYPSVKRALLVGIVFGFALATKISSIVLLSPIMVTLAADFALIFFRQPHRPRIWLPHLPAFAKHLLTYLLIIGGSSLLTFIFLEPYAVLDFQNFLKQTLAQSEMTRSAFTFPYTLQYVGKIPYLYELKNIFLFGLGPILAIPSFIGIFIVAGMIIKKEKEEQWAKELILFVFLLTYSFIVGNFAIGFMRYMLPVYPIFVICAAVAIAKLFEVFNIHSRMRTILTLYIAGLMLLWPLSFLNIYMHNVTRVDASTWIHKNIPTGEKLAVEHWDDALPLFGAEKYTTLTLPLYDDETDEKWRGISETLKQTDYIILSSNRLYTPLQKLTDCSILPPGKCYTRTASYYQRLFNGTLGFQKVAEFTSYPTIPFFTIPIEDQSSDESFTVYDHPKVTLFKKIATPPAL